MAAPWTNPDGLQVKLANYYNDPYNSANQARAISTMGSAKELVIDVDLTQIATGTTSFTTDLNNDGTRDGFSDGDPRLPAYSSVLDVRYLATVAATGGTSFTVGTYRLTGTTISATSLLTATEGVIANHDTIGKRTYGAGALVSTAAGTVSVGANDAYIGITTSGTYTAGKGKLIVRYIDTLADAEANV